MQLVAYGAQDIYLTGNPMITYFKVVYRRHTNFAMESIEQTFSGSPGFNQKVSCLISRNGDLVSGVTLQTTLPLLQNSDGTGGTRWTNDVGHHLIKEVSVSIGGQQIDKHYSDWLEIWAQLTVPAGHMKGYREMIGQDFGYEPFHVGHGARGLQDPTAGQDNDYVNPGPNVNASNLRVIYVPLQFWFCRNVGLALPLIALQYHEVKIDVQFETLANLTFGTFDDGAGGTPALSGTSLWVDYIYLDTDERRRFAQVSHEYLIEQLQFTGDESYSAVGAKNIKLNFNHPVKELVWVGRETGHTNQWSNYTTLTAGADLLQAAPNTAAAATDTGDTKATARAREPHNITQDALLQLNGHDRFAKRDGSYFNRVQTRCHTNIPISPGINVYSFALKPEDHQPSGTCNFSRIDNATLKLTLDVNASTAGVIKVFAVNYNVLRIMSGMGGLAYSN